MAYISVKKRTNTITSQKLIYIFDMALLRGANYLKLIIRIPKLMADQLGLSLHDYVVFKYDDENPRRWLITKSYTRDEGEMIYKLQRYASKGVMLSIHWNLFAPEHFEFEAQSPKYEVSGNDLYIDATLEQKEDNEND